MKKMIAAALAGVLVLGAVSPVLAEEDNKITIAASATPHAEILEKAAPILEEQ